MKLIFVRHGKDPAEYRGGFSQIDLNDEGREQVNKLAEYIWEKRHFLNISKIYSSDLPRTLSTAEGIASKLSIPIVLEKRIREMDNGDLAGMLNSEAEKKYPGLYFNTLRMDEKYPNGESPIEFYKRIEKWFYEIIEEKEQNGNILIVTHSGVINIIYHIINRIEWSNKSKAYKAANCSIHILNVNTMQFEVENNTEFLIY